MTIPPPTLPPLVAIVGPTAVGKSSLALTLAQRFRGEIVNADSRQLYQHMDIGTAKPSADDRTHVAHHLYDVAPPQEPIGLARYLEMVRPVIADIQHRGGLPIVVGGSGQYVWALLEGWDAPAVPPDADLRARLECEADEHGPMHLYDRLRALDPNAAAMIDPRNVRRVIRALEVQGTTGQRFSEAKSKHSVPFRSLVLGVTTPTRQGLYACIDRRVDVMLEAGWLDEVKWLLHHNYTSTPVFQGSMGYPELLRVLTGDVDMDEAAENIKAAHHRLARHQYAWFRLRDPRIHWLTTDVGVTAQAERMVGDFLLQTRAFA